MPVSARQCAVELLVQVLDEKRPFDEAVLRHGGLAALSERDRNFARLLVLTCLRRLGQTDALLAGMLASPLKGKSHDVMHALRLGVVQLIWLATPAHAAVHAMVETVGELGHERMKGLVNAVLKRVAQEGAALAAAQDEARLNVPGWLYERWRAAYGDALARAIALARLGEPALDLTVKNDAAAWAEKLGAVLLPTGSLRLARAGRVEALPGYGEGAWWVQDAAASLPARMAGDLRGKKVLDLCSAPGGKAAQFAAMGAEVTAVDQSKRRLELLVANLRRLGLQTRAVEADILKWKPDFTPDVILLDAPCSATGTLRRHPEVVWHRSREDILELAALQKRMLRRVAGWLAPGGTLLYCVCSLEPEEGELQAKDFLAAHPDFGVMPAPTEALAALAPQGVLRTHPALMADLGGMDGFYAIALHRLNNL